MEKNNSQTHIYTHTEIHKHAQTHMNRPRNMYKNCHTQKSLPSNTVEDLPDKDLERMILTTFKQLKEYTKILQETKRSACTYV